MREIYRLPGDSPYKSVMPKASWRHHVKFQKCQGYGKLWVESRPTIWYHIYYDDVIKWKHFRVTGPLCGEFTGPGEFPTQRPVTLSFDVFFDLRLNKRLSKQPWGWWFETPSLSLWHHCNVYMKNLTSWRLGFQGLSYLYTGTVWTLIYNEGESLILLNYM